LVVAFYSCTDQKDEPKEVPSISKEVYHPPSDTFNVRDLLRGPSLQLDIPLDTIEIPQNKKHKGMTIVYPKLSKEDFPEVYKSIEELIKISKKEFYEMVKDDKVVYHSESGLYEGWSMGMGPVSLYQTDKVISFSIEDGRAYTGMPSGFEYNMINYDLERKKKITFKDYFILNTAADSAYMERLIARAMNREQDFNLKKFIEFHEGINFSFDDDYVYFYRDKYDALGFGITSIKKKYILDHINPGYR